MIQKAKIVAVEGRNLTCTIECVEACAGCSAKALCGKTESKTIELVDTSANGRQVGDVIELELGNRAGFKAIGIVYLMPVVVIIAALFISQAAGCAELWQGIIAIVAVVIYYLMVKIFGLGKSISITIIDNE